MNKNTLMTSNTKSSRYTPFQKAAAQAGKRAYMPFKCGCRKG